MRKLVAVGLLLLGTAFAAPTAIPVSGADASLPGAFRIEISPDQYQVQDVFEILHGSQAIGEAMLVKMDGTRAVLVPSLHVKEHVYPGGFSVVFLHHHQDYNATPLSASSQYLLAHPVKHQPGLVSPGEPGSASDPVEITSLDVSDRDLGAGGSSSYVQGVQWTGSVIIKNTTARPLKGVAITVRFMDGYQQELHHEEKVVGTLPPGEKFGFDFSWMQPVKGQTRVVAEARYLPSLRHQDRLALKRAGEPIPPANVPLVVKRERDSAPGVAPPAAGTIAPGSGVDNGIKPDDQPVGY
ncbi:MAG: hypothetical protein ACYCW6_16810 [Candidatus Xenobia bacterium]